MGIRHSKKEKKEEKKEKKIEKGKEEKIEEKEKDKIEEKKEKEKEEGNEEGKEEGKDEIEEKKEEDEGKDEIEEKKEKEEEKGEEAKEDEKKEKEKAKKDIFYLNTLNLIKNVKFYYEENEPVAEIINGFYEENEKQLITTSISVLASIDNNNSLIGYVNKNAITPFLRDDKNIIKDSVYICDKVNLLVTWQEIISLLKFKVSNKLELNEMENNLLNCLSNLERNEIIKFSVIFKKQDLSLIIDNSSGKLEVPAIFYDDIHKIIKKKLSDRNAEDQLKLDIYNQIILKGKSPISYEKELDYVYSYFLNRFYPKICIAYQVGTNNKVYEKEITLSHKESLLLA